MTKLDQMIAEPQVEKVKIADLVLDDQNPNKMTKEQMLGLQESMRRFGYLTPIVIDQDNRIADGEHRVEIYKQFGLEEIPAYKVEFKDDIERKLLRQTMNKLRGEHDRQLDSAELAIIFKSDRLDDLAQLVAQDKEDIQRLILRYNPGLDFVTAENQADVDRLIDDELKRQVPDTQLGDLYQLGNHRLVCGDCTDKRVLDKLIGDAKVSQLNTDPPYGVDYAGKNKWLNEIDKGNHVQTSIIYDESDRRAIEFRELLGHVFKALEDGDRWAEYNTFYIWSAGMHLHELRLAIQEAKLSWGDYLVWVKNNHVLGRKDYNAQHEFCIYGWKDKHKFYGGFRTTVLEYPKPLINDLHPLMKPIELIRQTVTDGSQKDERILDAFAGSGTSLIVCEQTERKCLAVELDPHYCDVIIKRWESYTGQKAVKIV